jgi:(E)-4-hydroxy-3-methylbut-2-enyl-diphosphate synthase
VVQEPGVTSVRGIQVGPVQVGGGAPVAVQSMTCTRTGDADATLAQVRALVAAGCEIVRVSLPTAEEAPAFARVVREAPAPPGGGPPVPVIADVHYDWRLALAAVEAGAAGVRINPGTMAEKHVREIVRAAAEARVPAGLRSGGEGAPPGAGPGMSREAPVAIRIGVNAGSLPRDLRDRAAREPAETLVEAALRWARQFDEWGFRHYKLSVKSSSVPVTIAAYRLLAQRSDAPLHVGVTEAGTVWGGTVKSAVGIGALLADGIGDTLRVSLTGDPVEEVRVAWKILAALDLRRRGPDVISCPTCGRTEVDIVRLAEEVERRLGDDPTLAGEVITVAVMGCRVNGPEEAKHADYGIAAGSGEGVLFDHGERVGTLPERQLVDALLALIRGARHASPARRHSRPPQGAPPGA